MYPEIDLLPPRGQWLEATRAVLHQPLCRLSVVVLCVYLFLNFIAQLRRLIE